MLGPQQFNSMTFLTFSSCDLCILLEIAEEEDPESFLAWEYDLMLFLACCCSDLKTPFHLQIPWSFRASTAPILAATIQALQAAFTIFADFFFFWYLILKKIFYG